MMNRQGQKERKEYEDRFDTLSCNAPPEISQVVVFRVPCKLEGFWRALSVFFVF